jgi:hypothetical protein
MHKPAPLGIPPASGRDLERRVQALGADSVAARWISARVGAYLQAMLRRFGLSHARARQRFPLELLTAEARCATCGETARCRRFLAGMAGPAEHPSTFCPNASLFRQLRHRRSGARPGHDPCAGRHDG